LPSHATSGARSFPIELVRAVFNSETSANDVMVSGLPRLHVKVQPKGTSGHLTAELIEVSITGEERIVGRTIMNLMFADGTETMKPLSPGATIVAKMEFQPLDFVLRAENQLRVRVWQAQDPSLDRLPALPPSPVELLFGTSNDSVLELPIIERPAHVFFDPPRPSQAGAPAKDGTP
jgi:predicted acyl esterase